MKKKLTKEEEKLYIANEIGKFVQNNLEEAYGKLQEIEESIKEIRGCLEKTRLWFPFDKKKKNTKDELILRDGEENAGMSSMTVKSFKKRKHSKGYIRGKKALENLRRRC